MENSEAELVALWSEARSHCEQSSFDKAVEIHKGILTSYEDHAQACERACASLDEVYLTIRYLDLTESYLKQAVSYSPMNPQYHYLLGFTYSVHRQ